MFELRNNLHNFLYTFLFFCSEGRHHGEKRTGISTYRSDTITKLKEEQFESLGLDTLTVSLDLKMNRANISRLLNQLYNEGRLIKTDSRPVFFMDRSALDRYVEHAYIPSIIPKDKTIKDYLAIR